MCRLGYGTRHDHQFYTIFGAMATIFAHLFCLTSPATTPRIRFPMGCPALESITIALSSKTIRVPSRRRTGDRVRTTSPRRTSPFLSFPTEATVELLEELEEVSPVGTGRAFLTTQTISSPNEAERPPPRTLMHSASRAPELSMTCSCCETLYVTSIQEVRYLAQGFELNHLPESFLLGVQDEVKFLEYNPSTDTDT